MNTENKNTETVDIELRHSEVDAILNDPPAWIVRVGSYMIYGLILTLIIIAAIIKYPDTVTAEIELKTGNVASITLPYSNLAKQIKNSSSINIELDNYPAKDFGFVQAKIERIEYSAINAQYKITLLLPQVIILNGGIKVNHSGLMKGKATVKINNKTLLQRVLATLMK